MTSIAPTLNPFPKTMAKTGRRALGLFDLENFIGGTVTPTWRLDRICSLLVQNTNHFEQMMPVVAVSHFTARHNKIRFPGARYRWRSGTNGADLALIEEGSAPYVTKRFTDLVIGSGDAEFTDLARDAQAEGLTVTVLARSGSLARDLARQADRVIEVTVPTASCVAA